MSKKQKKNGYGKGTFIETQMFLSKAFMNLGVKGTSPKVSIASPKILMMLLGKRQFGTIKDDKGRKKKVRSDDNKFTLTYKELESHGIHQKTATRGIDELLSKGFISIVDPGGLFEKHKAVYALENDYLFWHPDGSQVFRTRQRDVLRGYQGKHRKKIADVNDGHPHGRQRRTPSQEDTDVNDGHPQDSQNKEEKVETTC